MRKEAALGFVLLLGASLLSSIVVRRVSAQTYGYCWVSTYCINVSDDVANGILRFEVFEPVPGLYQILTVQIYSGSYPQYMRTLRPGDIVEIDYRDCSIATKVIQVYGPGQYLINYRGEANSVVIDGSEIPEFALAFVSLVGATILFACLFSRRSIAGRSHTNRD